MDVWHFSDHVIFIKLLDLISSKKNPLTVNKAIITEMTIDGRGH